MGARLLIMWDGGVLIFYVNIVMDDKVCKSWWRHEMETFSALLAICAGNSPVDSAILWLQRHIMDVDFRTYVTLVIDSHVLMSI